METMSLHTNMHDKPDTLYVKEYINYDFISKSPRSRDALIYTMAKGCKALEALNVRYWLGRGSVLGFHRDNDFLPTDIDIDIDMLGDKEMYQIIHRLPFEPLFVTINKGHYQQFAFLDRETDVIFDIWSYYENGGVFTNRNYFGYFWLPKNILTTLRPFSFDGVQYPIPDPDWYCDFWYGENWRIPKRYGNDWSIEYRKDCKGFMYTGEKDIVQSIYY